MYNKSLAIEEVPEFTSGNLSQIVRALGRSGEVGRERNHNRQLVAPEEFIKEQFSNVSQSRQQKIKQTYQYHAEQISYLSSYFQVFPYLHFSQQYHAIVLAPAQQPP